MQDNCNHENFSKAHVIHVCDECTRVLSQKAYRFQSKATTTQMLRDETSWWKGKRATTTRPKRNPTSERPSNSSDDLASNHHKANTVCACVRPRMRCGRETNIVSWSRTHWLATVCANGLGLLVNDYRTKCVCVWVQRIARLPPSSVVRVWPHLSSFFGALTAGFGCFHIGPAICPCLVSENWIMAPTADSLFGGETRHKLPIILLLINAP